MAQFHDGQDVEVAEVRGDPRPSRIWRKAKIIRLSIPVAPGEHTVQFPDGAYGVFDAEDIREETLGSKVARDLGEGLMGRGKYAGIMTMIPGLTLVRKQLETYLVVRDDAGDRELTDRECAKLWQAANSHDRLLAAAKEVIGAYDGNESPNWSVTMGALQAAIAAAEEPAP
jgi:hypothetical protein